MLGRKTPARPPTTARPAKANRHYWSGAVARTWMASTSSRLSSRAERVKKTGESVSTATPHSVIPAQAGIRGATALIFRDIRGSDAGAMDPGFRRDDDREVDCSRTLGTPKAIAQSMKRSARRAAGGGAPPAARDVDADLRHQTHRREPAEVASRRPQPAKSAYGPADLGRGLRRLTAET